MSSKLRWGILGTGNIARQFARGVAASQRGVTTAVGSRSMESAQTFARDFHVPTACGSYGELIAQPDVDAVYNALPNHLHLKWTVDALKAGKHVLCEKPLAMDFAEAEEMFDMARKSGRVLGEAFMYRSHPQTIAVLETLASGAIGDVRLVRTNFCYRTRKPDGNVRFVKEWGGGALMDIGCYCVHFSRTIANAEPTAVSVVANFHSSGVDELAAGTMVFPGGLIASFAAGMCLHADNTTHIFGSEGFIEIPIPWKAEQSPARFTIARGNPPKMDGPSSTSAPPREVRSIEFTGNLYGIEADDFVATAQDGAEPRITAADSLGNMKVLDEMRRQIGLVF
jgi:D-xylose 1-dehydrogenase (NADP+, D-xylono-1,5-lactone-forming)